MLSFMVFSQTRANPDDAAIKKSLTYFVNSIQSKKIDQGGKLYISKILHDSFKRADDPNFEYDLQ